MPSFPGDSGYFWKYMDNLAKGCNGGRPVLSGWQRYALAVLASVLAALIATPLYDYLDLPNL